MTAALPNWKIKAEYPTDLPQEGWAWEFLRRNEQYQQQWSEYEAHVSADSAKYKVPPQLLPNSGLGKPWGLEEMYSPAIAWLDTSGLQSRPRFASQHILGY